MYADTWSESMTVCALVVSFLICAAITAGDMYKERAVLANKGGAVKVLWITLLMTGLACIIVSMADDTSSVYWDVLGGVLWGISALVKGYAIKYRNQLKQRGFLVPIKEREYGDSKTLIIGGWGFLLLVVICFGPAILPK